MSNKDYSLEIQKINEKIDRIEIKLNKLLLLCSDDISKNCDKMANHIDFIDNVYDKVKYPLEFLTNQVNNFLSYSSQNQIELPDNNRLNN